MANVVFVSVFLFCDYLGFSFAGGTTYVALFLSFFFYMRCYAC